MYTTPFSQRAEPSPLWSRACPKRRIRRGTTRNSRIRCEEAKRGCASRVPLLARRNGAPHGRGAGGESDPTFRPLVRHGEGQRGTGVGTPFAPTRGEVALTTVIPSGRPSNRPSGQRVDHRRCTGHKKTRLRCQQLKLGAGRSRCRDASTTGDAGFDRLKTWAPQVLIRRATDSERPATLSTLPERSHSRVASVSAIGLLIEPNCWSSAGASRFLVSAHSRRLDANRFPRTGARARTGGEKWEPAGFPQGRSCLFYQLTRFPGFLILGNRL